MRIRDWLDEAERATRDNDDELGRSERRENGGSYTYSIAGDVSLTIMSLRGEGDIVCMAKRQGDLADPLPAVSRIASTSEHRHDYIELAYAWRGPLKQVIGGEESLFAEGEFCIIDRETSHREIPGESGNVVVFLCLAQSFFDEPFLAALGDYYIGQFLRVALRGQESKGRFLRFSPRPGAPELDSLLDAILGEYASGAKGSRYVIKGLVLRLLDLLISSYESHLSEAQSESYDETIFAELDAFLRKNYRSVSIDLLTKAFNYNPDFYNRLIRRRTGKTYSQYLQSIRLCEAERLLRESDMPIDEIASEVGYENKGYFYKIFRDKNGLSPNEYRLRR
jgi:Response regulator containing CheY-like receiver domain and AraC-type DNA-binding domain